MAKKALIIASMASMIDNFNRNNIKILEDLKYEITIAANFVSEDSNSLDKNEAFRLEMEDNDCKVIQIDFSRKISNIKKQIQSIKQVKKALKTDYDLIHCHSPICAAITRLLAKKKRKSGTTVIYTVHGFHFYKGAPLKNWLIYYPIEKFCSYFTDTLITINHEDYELAKRKMKAKQIEYVPGVGIDVEKFKNTVIDKVTKRREIGLPVESFLLISVGELNENKNQKIVIKAMAQLNNPNIHYMIAGKGPMKDPLLNFAAQLGVSDQLHLLGFREDVAELYKAADVNIFPSIREGLPVALMEAMASGLPCVASNIRGCNDLLDENGGSLFDPYSESSCKEAIEKILNSDLQKMGTYNLDNVKKYSTDTINQIMKAIYERL